MDWSEIDHETSARYLIIIGHGWRHAIRQRGSPITDLTKDVIELELHMGVTVPVQRLTQTFANAAPNVLKVGTGQPCGNLPCPKSFPWIPMTVIDTETTFLMLNSRIFSALRWPRELESESRWPCLSLILLTISQSCSVHRTLSDDRNGNPQGKSQPKLAAARRNVPLSEFARDSVV